MPNKLQNVTNEFFDAHSKVNDDIKLQDTSKFPYMIEKEDDVINSPSLE